MADEPTASDGRNPQSSEMWPAVAISDGQTTRLGIALLAQFALYAGLLWLAMPSPEMACINVIGIKCFAFEVHFRPIFIVLLAGAIGGLLHAIMSFALHLARRDFSRSWIWWYITRPIQGAIVAVAVYFAVRLARQSDAPAQPADVNSVVAIAVLAGIFSEQAVEKLAQMANTILSPGRQKEGSETALPAPRPTIASVDKSEIYKNEAAKLSIKGSGFIKDRSVAWLGNVRLATTVTSDTELEAAVVKDQVKDVGRKSLFVFTAGGGSSDAKPIEIKERPAPASAAPTSKSVVSDVVPPSIKAGGGDQPVALKGTGLDKVTKVEIGGKETAPTKKSATELTVSVDAAALKPGSHAISLDGKDTGKTLTVT